MVGTFTATSGNGCSYEAGFLGMEMSLRAKWDALPTEADDTEFQQHIESRVSQLGGTILTFEQFNPSHPAERDAHVMTVRGFTPN